MVENDKAAIIELINLYGIAVDTLRFDLLDRVFTQDVHMELGPAGAVWSGLAKIKYAFADFQKTLDNHQHLMSGHLVHVDGDKAYAFTYGTWLLVREAAKGGSQWQGRGWYDDELVRTEDGWRIQRRTCRLLSWTGNPLVPEPAYEQTPIMTTHVLRDHAEAGKIGFLRAISKK